MFKNGSKFPTLLGFINLAAILALMVVVAVLAVNQGNTNSRVADVDVVQAASLHAQCERGNAARQVQLHMFDLLIPGTGNGDQVHDTELRYAATATNGITAYPKSTDPHLLAIADCDKYYPLQP